MAGRILVALDVAAFANAFAKLVGVMLVWLVALMLWNVGAHSPLAALASFFRRQPLQKFLGHATRLLGGSVAAFGALRLLYATLTPIAQNALPSFAIATFLGAFFVEFLIGEDLRRTLAGR